MPRAPLMAALWAECCYTREAVTHWVINHHLPANTQLTAQLGPALYLWCYLSVRVPGAGQVEACVCACVRERERGVDEARRVGPTRIKDLLTDTCLGCERLSPITRSSHKKWDARASESLSERARSDLGSGTARVKERRI